MTKVEYLQLLKDCLSGKIHENELNDILSDYEGFFLTGMEEGRSEATISAELGNPLEIAQSLIDSADKRIVLCYAPVYKRIVAVIIDIILAGLPFVWFAPITAIGLYFMPQILFNLIPSLSSTVNGSSHQWISQLQPLWSAAIIASGLWFLLINPISMLIFKGYTVGKRIMGIRVVSIDGTTANIIQLVVREWIGKYFVNMLGSLLPSVLAVLPSVASLIWASISKQHSTIHDAIARTCVVECKYSSLKKR